MNSASRLNIVIRWFALFACSGAILLLVPLSLLNSTAGQTVKPAPDQALLDLKKKFEGSASCSNAKCHGKDGADSPPKEIAHEVTIWSEKDKHKNAHATLSTDDSTAIGKKLSPAIDPTSSEKCLSCHAI